MSDTTNLQETVEQLGEKPCVHFLIVNNPLDPKKDSEVHLREWAPTLTLKDYIGDLSDNWLVLHRKERVPLEKLDTIIPAQNDVVALTPIPRDSTTAKQILAIVAIIVLTYFTFGLGSASAGAWGSGFFASLGGGGLTGYAIATAVFVGGSMVINSVLGPQVPNQHDWNSSPSYGLDGPKNASTAGIPTPVVSGPYRVGGNIIALHTTLGEMLLGGKSPAQADWTLPYASLTDYDESNAQTAGVGYTDAIYYRQNDYDQFLYMLLNAGEGEIDGIEDIEINDQPISDFETCEWAFRPGVDNQEVLNPFNSILNATSIAATMDTADVYTQRQTAGVVDRIRVDLIFPAGLYFTNSKGGTESRYVHINVEVKKTTDSTWLKMYDLTTATGDVAEAYTVERASKDPVRVSLWSPDLPPGQYDVRIKRDNAPINKQVTNMTWVDLWDITNETIRYNYTGLLALKIRMDDQLHAIPKVTYVNRGTKFRYYDEVGGNWQTGVTDNPAWITWNFMTNTRWGVGLSESRLDEFAFREWAQHCEDNNLKWRGIFEQQQTVWDTIAPVLLVGRANLIRVGNKYTVSVEKEKDPVMAFNVGNIKADSFQQQWLGVDGRANEVQATYYDKDDGYKPKVVKVVDSAAQSKTGVSVASKLNFVGIDNLDQAQKEAQYHLNMNALVSTISFETSIEALSCMIGDVVSVQHDQPEWGNGGRLTAGSTTTTLELDRPVTMSAGSYQALIVYDSLVRNTSTVSSVVSNVVYITGLDWTAYTGNADKIKINGTEYTILRQVSGSPDDGVEIDDATGVSAGQTTELIDLDAIETRDVVLNVGDHSTITLSSALPSAPPEYTKWMFGPISQNVVQYTVREIKQSGDFDFTLNLLEYNPNVFTTAAGTVVTPYSYTTDPLGPVTFGASPVVQELLNGVQTREQYSILLSWYHDNYRYKDATVYMSLNSKPFINMGRYISNFRTTGEIDDVFRFIVVPRSIEGVESAAAAQTVITYTVIAGALEPLDPPGSFAIGEVTPFTIELTWTGNIDPSVVYEIYWKSNSGGGTYTIADAILLARVSGTTSFIVPGLIPDVEYTFWIRALQALDTTVQSAWSGGTNGLIQYTSPSPASPALGVKINVDSFTNVNAGELYIHGFDGSGSAADVDGYVLYNSAKFTVTKGSVLGTDSADQVGYLVLETAGGNVFAHGGSQQNIGICTFAAGVWKYDNNTSMVTFSPTDTMVVIGSVVQTPSGITNAQVWEYPLSLSVVSEPSATYGADWQTNLANIPTGLRNIYYQSTAPTAENVGDYWIDSDDDSMWRWDGSVWSQVQDADIATALSDAATAQATADGKVVTFFQGTAPTAYGVGDLWFDSANNYTVYRWNGSSWENAPQDTADWAKVFGANKPADNATVGGQLGTDVTDEYGSLLHGIDLRNDRMVKAQLSALNFNPGYEIPRQDVNGDLCPASWFRFDSTSFIRYVDPTGSRDVVYMPITDAIKMTGASIRVNPRAQYEIVLMARMSAGTGDLYIDIAEKDSELSSGKRALMSTTGTNAESEVEAGDRLVGAESHSLTNSFTTYVYTYTPTATAIWFSPIIYSDSESAGQFECEWCVVREKAVAPPEGYLSLVPMGYDDCVTLIDNSVYPIGGATVGIQSSGYFGNNAIYAQGVTTANATWGVNLCVSTSSRNTGIPANSKFLLIASCQRTAAGAVDLKGALNTNTNTYEATAQSVSYSGSTWYRMAWVIDLSADGNNTCNIRFLMTNGPSTLGYTPQFAVDGIALIDITNLPQLNETLFPQNFIPAGRSAIATVDHPGLAIYATYPEAYAGTSNIRAMTPATVAGWWSNWVANHLFQSANQTIALNGNVAHGLGGTPQLFWAVLNCVTTDSGKGYTAGDRLFLPGSVLQNANTPWTIWANDTYIGWSLYTATQGYSYTMDKANNIWDGTLVNNDWKITLFALYF